MKQKLRRKQIKAFFEIKWNRNLEENRLKFFWDKMKQKGSFYIRGNLPRTGKAGCLGSLHLQMVPCCGNNWFSLIFATFPSLKALLESVWSCGPDIGPFSSKKRRQVFRSISFIDALITLLSAFVISWHRQWHRHLNHDVHHHAHDDDDLKEEADFASLPVKPGSIKMGAGIWSTL